ncbi:PRI1 [Lepeophtheirus salmonis]|uniref:DNA primase n=1 Tax=Lepeophtheirus salmonis TaxID=72036 RepID=A0A7R8CF23_LEPSM|nr:PRI1 [Lepeophtheirus salmonis]CAF2802325.1 PRI1 [Lepeophtheirus salmonis]
MHLQVRHPPLHFALSLVYLVMADQNDPDLSTLSNGVFDFTTKLFSEACLKDSNGVFSGYSLANILSMTSFGAKGKTLTEIRETLGLPTSQGTIKAAYSRITNDLVSDKHITIEIANGIFPQDNFQIKDSFIKNTQDAFKAEVHSIDYSDSKEAVEVLNSWVETKTHNKIKDLFSSDSIDASTVTVFVNAIYFKGSWKSKFDSKRTKNRDFYVSPNQKIQVPTMFAPKIEVGSSYIESLKSEIIILPYEGDQYEMYLIVPDDRFGLPEFKLESFYNLKDSLRAIGIKQIFSDKSDLSGIAGSPNQLYVSKIFQKATIEVNEEGSEAAAASGVVMMMRSMPMPPTPVVIDHPFMFFIKDKQTGLYLLFGADVRNWTKKGTDRTMGMSVYSPDLLDDHLPIYYKRLFPYESYCRWLGSIDKAYFSRREFSFTLRDDIYLRYQSFSTWEELRTEMCRMTPHKIDIGAIFNARPSDHKKISVFAPQEKEIVFDIDMTDYDDVRYCCSGAEICPKCWKFMVIAVKVLDEALRQDFGFQHLLWVYSGRRGIHCWVSDPSAKKLGQSARSAIAEYLQVLSGGDSRAKKVLIKGKNVHPSIARALKIASESFESICLVDQDILGEPERWNNVLSLIPDETVREKITSKMPTASTSLERRKTSNHILKEIVLQYLYPRLDINVTKGLNHLLKSPFCVHPKTGRICVPLDPNKIEQFDPLKVPTISQLIEEIDRFSKNNENAVISKDYKKTSLRGPMVIFDEFLSKLSQTWKGRIMEISDATMEF